MNRWTAVGCVVAMTLMPMVAPRAGAQCVDETFDDFSVDTPITTQVDGVTFVVAGQSCGGDPVLHMRVADEWYGDSFVSDVLLIDGGCPDFSSDYIRMIFDDLQSEARFLLGPWSGWYEIRAYNAASGGTLVRFQRLYISGSGFVDVHHPVVVSRSDRDIRRIEIEADGAGWEAIDDLRFGRDTTAPVVQVDAPVALSCVSGAVSVNGVVCDEDGAYDRDRLEYLSTWPLAMTDWTLIREYVDSPVCDPGTLYGWDTVADGVPDGPRVLRVTSRNECGLSAAVDVPVLVDNQFDTVEIRTPMTGSVVGGVLCVDGTATDIGCFDHYEVAYRPSGGSWSPANPATPTHGTPVTDDVLDYWSASQGLSDGSYELSVTGFSATGASASDTVSVTLDKTLPTIEFTHPVAGSVVSGVVTVTGTASDTHLHEWSLQVLDPDTGDWTYLGDDSDSIVDGYLGTWDTTGLPYSSYALRLRVVEDTLVGCAEAAERRVTETLLPVTVAMFADGFEAGTTTNWSGSTP
jgi:hypothetical protein